MVAFAPSRRELAELERGVGEWENIQEVLRGAFRRVFVAVAATDTRVAHLEHALEAKTRELERQKQHMEALTRTLNAASEELRREEEEEEERHCAVQRQSEALCERVGALERALARACGTPHSGYLAASVAKVEHRLGLVEDEIGHVVEAVERKADVETLESSLVSQKRAMQEALRRRCKTLEVERELLTLRQRLEKQLSDSFQELTAKAATTRRELEDSGSAALTNAMKGFDSRLDCTCREVESGVDSRMNELDARISAVQSAVTAANSAATAAAAVADAATREIHESSEVLSQTVCAGVQKLQQRLDESVAADHQARAQVLADCDSIRRDLQACEARLEANQFSLRQELEAVAKVASDRSGEDQLQALETRLADSQRSATIELQVQLADVVDRMDSERRELESHRRDHGEQLRSVREQLQEVDHVTRLVGKQLVRSVSQLHVLWEERRTQLEAAANAHEQLPSVGASNLMTMSEKSSRHGATTENQEANGHDEEVLSDDEVEKEDLSSLRSEHDALQLQVNEKLQRYQSLLRLEQ